jgi:hypothetical protein
MRLLVAGTETGFRGAVTGRLTASIRSRTCQRGRPARRDNMPHFRTLTWKLEGPGGTRRGGCPRTHPSRRAPPSLVSESVLDPELRSERDEGAISDGEI